VEVVHGVTINPVAFLVINKDSIKLMPINHTYSLDKLMDYIPDILDKVSKKSKSKDDNDAKKEENNNEEETKNTNIEVKAEVQKEVIEPDADYLEDE